MLWRFLRTCNTLPQGNSALAYVIETRHGVYVFWILLWTKTNVRVLRYIGCRNPVARQSTVSLLVLVSMYARLILFVSKLITMWILHWTIYFKIEAWKKQKVIRINLILICFYLTNLNTLFSRENNLNTILYGMNKI